MEAAAPLAIFLSDVAPVAVVVALGWLFGRIGLFTLDEARAINRLVLFIAAPALIFGLLAQTPLGAGGLRLPLGYLVSELVVYGGTFLIARRLARVSRREALLLGMAAAFVNHVFFVLPVVENAYGIAARAPIMPLIAIDSIVLFTGTIVLIEAIVQDRFSLKTGVLAALRTPYVLAVLAGLGFNFAGLRQPEGLAAFTGFLGAAASPAALFALGIVLSRMRILGRDPLAWAVSGIKVVVHPLLAVLLFAASQHRACDLLAGASRRGGAGGGDGDGAGAALPGGDRHPRPGDRAQHARFGGRAEPAHLTAPWVKEVNKVQRRADFINDFKGRCALSPVKARTGPPLRRSREPRYAPFWPAPLRVRP